MDALDELALQREEVAWRRFAATWVPAQIAEQPVRSVLHVGSGTGALLATFLEHGVGEVHGIERRRVPPEALRIPRACFTTLDCGATFRDRERPFDLVVVTGEAAAGVDLGRLGVRVIALPCPDPRTVDAGLAPPRPESGATPKVAVVVPCHDYGRYLPDAVASVATQTWRHVQCVIVDDGSDDDSADIAAQLQREHRDLDLGLLRQPNRGVSQARNVGARASSAPLLLQLDADDRLHPEAIARMVATLQANPEIDVVHCDAQEFGDGDQVMAGADRVDTATLRRGNRLNYCGLMRRALFFAVGGYRDIRGGYDDWDLWLSVAKFGGRFHHLPEILLHYRRHGASVMDRGRHRDAILRAQVVRNHPDLFSARKLTLARDVLDGDANGSTTSFALGFRQRLDLLGDRRLRRALRG